MGSFRGTHFYAPLVFFKLEIKMPYSCIKIKFFPTDLYEVTFEDGCRRIFTKQMMVEYGYYVAFGYDKRP